MASSFFGRNLGIQWQSYFMTQAKPTSKRSSELSTLLGSMGPALHELRKNDPLRMAGATAFFTTFALPPIIFLLIQLFGLFVDRRSIGQEVMTSLANTLGDGGAAQVRTVLRSIRGFGDSWYVVIIGFLFMAFVATTLFSVIKNSLNQIWLISIREHPGFLFALKLRFRSMAVILVSGLLFVFDMLSEGLETIAAGHLENIWKGSGLYFQSILDELIGIIIVVAWFIVLFRFLADGRPCWRATIMGGLLTGFLFVGGRLLLQYLLIDSNIGKLYGASGSIVLVLLFVFYSSFILYYGACFVKIYSEKKDRPIRPRGKAYTYSINAVEEPIADSR
jgi:membrane protein